MYIKRVSLLILSLILIPIVFANNVDIKLYRNNYNSLETFQADINTNVQLSKDLSFSNIKLLDVNGNNIGVSKRLIKINKSEYKVYFNLPQLNDDKYTFSVSRFFYNLNGVTKEDSSNVNFDIINNKQDVLSINPGYVFGNVVDYDESPFTLVLKNSGDNSLDVNIKTEGNFLSLSQSTFSLASLSSKTINVNTLLYNKKGDSFTDKIIIQYNTLSYEIPAIIKRTLTKSMVEQNLTKVTNQTNITKLNNTVENITPVIVKEDVLEIGDPYGNVIKNISLYGYKGKTTEFSFVSNADLTLHGINLTVNGDIKNIISFEPSYLSSLPSYGIYPTNLIIKDITKNYTGTITVKSKEVKEFSLPVYITFEKLQENNVDLIHNKTINNQSVIIRTVTVESNSTTLLWILLGSIIFIILLLIYYLHKKNKPREEEFGRFIDAAKNRR